MPVLSWAIVENELVLKTASKVVYPSAIEVFQAEYSNRKIFDNFTIAKRPSEQLSQLTFSRFPIELLIVIENCSQWRSRSQVLVVAKIHSKRVSINLETRTDHLIFEATWFPFLEDALANIKNLFLSLAISPQSPIDLKQYFNLILQCRKSRQPFEDLTDFSAGHVAMELSPTQTEIGHFQGKMYPYQEQGFKWLSLIAGDSLGCILGDEMGLGKTIQVIALIASEVSRQDMPCLVLSLIHI